MDHPQAEVFDNTYQSYLEKIRKIDYLARADILGLKRDKNTLTIPYFNKIYILNEAGLVAEDGSQVSVPVRVILCKYILTCSSLESSTANRLQPFRDFKNAAPLNSYFTSNATSLIEKTFTGRLTQLKVACSSCGGRELASEVYDLSAEFYALPRIPVIVNFNDRDELFPAACSILYNSTAEQFLDMECLSMTGTHLASILTGYTSS